MIEVEFYAEDRWWTVECPQEKLDKVVELMKQLYEDAENFSWRINYM